VLYEAQAPIVHQKFTRLKALTSVRRGHHQRDLVQRLQQTHAVDDSGSVNVKALEAKCRFFLHSLAKNYQIFCKCMIKNDFLFLAYILLY
jgi:hypothetical protein